MMKKLNETIVCKDGTTLSVQASHFHYCTPRDDIGPYTTVEVGFPEDANGRAIPFPKSWRDDGQVAGYVPVGKVLLFIKRHGGIKSGKMP